VAGGNLCLVEVVPAIALRPARLWVSGPAPPADGTVVSVTDFAVARRRDTPAVMASGLRLALGWYAMEGAVGLWLWSLPRQWRSGSITVWTEEAHLRRFVGLPLHGRIMRRYRDRGRLRSDTWHSPGLTRTEVLGRACAWIQAGKP
jgi:hypothetical protein